MKVSVQDELVVAVPHKPGQLARVLEIAGKARIDLEGYVGYAMGPKGAVHVITRNSSRLKSLLRRGGYKFQASKVVVVVSSNTVGSGARMAAKLAKAGINVSAMHATAVGSQYLTTIQAPSPAKVVTALRK
ncbi:MAG TPA: hypothetical protein VIH35_00415 [Kiritimatiellia bacterium]|jgi:hypothetical protein